jgi:uncharacterized protein (TIGR03083 family)
MAEAYIEALRSSVDRLHGLTAAMTDADVTKQAYPTEWTIADVLSHLGSGAVIMQRRLEDALAGNDTPDDFAPGVWETWNAKTHQGKRDDALNADAALLARVDAVTYDQRVAFSFSMGPMNFGFEQFVAMRLNEHAFHTWDIEVTDDPAATIPAVVADLVVDNLDLIARFTARPTGTTTSISVATTDPARGFTIDLAPESVTFGTRPVPVAADVELPAEAFGRLVYGRLDADHTPPGDHGPELDVLRQVFPGP